MVGGKHLVSYVTLFVHINSLTATKPLTRSARGIGGGAPTASIAAKVASKSSTSFGDS